MPATLQRRIMLSSLLLLAACDGARDTRPVTTEEAHADSADESRVTLSEAAWRSAGIEVMTAAADTSRAGEPLTVPGQVEFDPRRIVMVSARVAARVESLAVVEGDRVGRGQVVALLFSPAFITAQADYLQSLRRWRLLAGTADDSGARAIVEAAGRRLEQLGASPGAIGELAAAGRERPTLPLAAPIEGTIMRSGVLPGQSVDAGQEIFRLADLSVVDVVAAIPERSLPLVRVGQRAHIGLAAYPDVRFAGRVERLSGELDHETRTIEAVIHAANPQGRLRPGMFATVHLAVTTDDLAGARGARTPAVTIPSRALVAEGERQFVFVEAGVRTYLRRQVRTITLAPPGSVRPEAALIGIDSGLAPGERVVISGAFTLKSELAKAGLGEHE